MEPAVERREHHINGISSAWSTTQPQWSPPLKGGSTQVETLKARLATVAAMEPAVERREHRDQDHAEHDFGDSAAMEPAVERREHRC